MDSLAKFLNPRFRYAVVGATTNRSKYGYTVLKDLAQAGFTVVGVNPKYSDIEGIHIYPTLADVPDRPDVAVFVVPPSIGLSLLDECRDLNISKVWFQPGAENKAIQVRIAKLKLEGQAEGACIMVIRKKLDIHA